MAITVLKNANIVVNGVDLSDHSSKVTIATSYNEVDVTTFGASFKQSAQGLGDASITVDFYQDYAASSVDATLWPLNNSGSIFPVVVKAPGTATPFVSWTMSQSILTDYNPVDGAVGDVTSTSVKFSNNGQSGIVRGTG